MLQVASREAELAEKLIAKQRQCDLLLLEISDLAAQLAETEYFDDQGFNSPIDWMRFTCHLSEKAAADRIAVGRMAPKLPESVQAAAPPPTWSSWHVQSEPFHFGTWLLAQPCGRRKLPEIDSVTEPLVPPPERPVLALTPVMVPPLPPGPERA